MTRKHKHSSGVILAAGGNPESLRCGVGRLSREATHWIPACGEDDAKSGDALDINIKIA